MDNERWKPVVGFEYFYEVSDAGRVRRRINREIMVPSFDGKGYPRVTLSRPGHRHKALIGVLVLEAFVGPRPEGMEMRHFPLRDSTCNYLENLSWATRSVNQRDRAIHGTTTKQVQRRVSSFSRSKRSDAS